MSSSNKQDNITIDIDISSEFTSEEYYFCPFCEAILDLQVGFSTDKDYWICLECSQHLYGDVYEGEQYPGVMWFCDDCESFLNKQSGFTDTHDTWVCTDCGFDNKLNIIFELPNIIIESDDV